MRSPTFTVIADLAAEIAVPARGILSETLSDENGVELTLFAFAAGQRLNEHAAARPAIIHVLAGEASLTIDGRTFEAHAGTWVQMAAGVRHALSAGSAMVLALYLLPSADHSAGPPT